MTGEPAHLSVNEQRIAFDALVRAADEFGYDFLEASIES